VALKLISIRLFIVLLSLSFPSDSANLSAFSLTLFLVDEDTAGVGAGGIGDSAV